MPVCCVKCGYDMRHRSGSPPCPECGHVATPVQRRAAARRVNRFRWWMTPLFLLPGVMLIACQRVVPHVLPADFLIRGALLVVSFAAAYAALRDHRGFDRLGTAVVLAIFLLLTNGLMAALL